MSTPNDKQYKAFFSYRRKADETFAKALRSKVERFAKGLFAFRRMSVFIDTSSLPLRELRESVQQALNQSEHLVVFASPESAESPHVAFEVDTWFKMGRPRSIIIVLTAGVISWNCETNDFDWATTTALSKNSWKEQLKAEPLYLDARWSRAASRSQLKKDARLLDTAAHIAATVCNLDKDKLWSEELRIHKRTVRYAFLAIIALCILSLGLLAVSRFAINQREEAIHESDANHIRAESLSIHASLKSASQSTAQQMSLNLARFSSRRQRIPPISVWNAARATVECSRQLKRVGTDDVQITRCQWSPDGRAIACETRDFTVQFRTPQLRLIKELRDGEVRISSDRQSIVQVNKDSIRVYNLNGDCVFAVTAKDDFNLSSFTYDNASKLLYSVTDELDLLCFDKLGNCSTARIADGAITSRPSYITTWDAGAILVFDVESCSLRLLDRLGQSLREVHFDASDDYVITSSPAGVCVFDRRLCAGTLLNRLLKQVDSIRIPVEYVDDIVIDWDNQIVVCTEVTDTNKGVQFYRFGGQVAGHPVISHDTSPCFSVSKSGRYLVTAGYEGHTIAISELDSPHVQTLAVPRVNSHYESVALHPTRNILAFGSYDGKIATVQSKGDSLRVTSTYDTRTSEAIDSMCFHGGRLLWCVGLQIYAGPIDSLGNGSRISTHLNGEPVEACILSAASRYSQHLVYCSDNTRVAQIDASRDFECTAVISEYKLAENGVGFVWGVMPHPKERVLFVCGEGVNSGGVVSAWRIGNKLHHLWSLPLKHYQFAESMWVDVIDGGLYVAGPFQNFSKISLDGKPLFSSRDAPGYAMLRVSQFSNGALTVGSGIGGEVKFLDGHGLQLHPSIGHYQWSQDEPITPCIPIVDHHDNLVLACDDGSLTIYSAQFETYLKIIRGRTRQR